MPRTYDQYCPLAVALDVVGDRWTLLIVRELITGPRRFSDLERAQPGLSPTLLSERLRLLQANGLVQSADAGMGAYALTDAGATLEPMIGGLARWGVGLLGPVTDDAVVSPAGLVGVLKAALDGLTVPADDATYQITIDDVPLTLRIHRGVVYTSASPSPRADAQLSADRITMWRLLRGEVNPDDASQAAIEATGAIDDLLEVLRSARDRITS